MSNAQIHYGIVFPEDYKFPWNEEKYRGNIESWWVYEILGFKHSFEIYDDTGRYIVGADSSDNVIDKYFDEYNEFKAKNKFPFTLVNYRSVGNPAYILAISKIFVLSSYNHPVKFDPISLKVTEEEKQNLIGFCKKYNLKYKEEPDWYLSACSHR